MSVVLAVEPDAAQAETLRELLRNRIGADLVLVSSTDAAIAEIDRGVPDLILLSNLLSPRDEDGLIVHLRSLEGASHLQTLTIPQFQTDREPAPSTKKTSFGGFRKKRAATAAPAGCDPVVFAKEISDYLDHAREVRSRSARVVRPRVVSPSPPPAPSSPPVLFGREEPVQRWEETVEPAHDEPVYDEVARPMQGFGPEPTDQESFSQESVSAVSASRDSSGETLIAQVARVQADAEAKLAGELDRVRAEAEEKRLVEVARFQVEADAFRQVAIDEARAAAESETRDALAAEMTRVRTKAEETVAEVLDRVKSEVEHLARVREEADEQSAAAHRSQEAAEAEARAMADELARLRGEAEKTLTSELARVRAEVQETLGHQLDKAKVEADRMREVAIARTQAETETLRTAAAEAARNAAEAAGTRALQVEVARVRAEAEARLQAELNRFREEAEQVRFVDQAEAKHTAEKMREAAAREARAVAQMAANRTLETEVARVRADAEALLEVELARTRAEAERRRVTELQEIRAQMAGLQEAAAQQASAAAAQAVASQVARATSESSAARAEPRVIRMQPKPKIARAAPARAERAAPPRAVESPAATTPSGEAPGGDYYSLWRLETPVPEKPPETQSPPLFRQPPPSRTKWKWALPLAAGLLFVAGNGIAIDTAAWLVGPAESTEGPAPPATAPEPVAPAPPQKKVGELRLASTPDGAQVLIDGRQYGKTPLTVPDLPAGRHTVVLRSDAGTITRAVTIKAGGTTELSESIFSGWLVVFSRIPLDIHVNGKPLWKTDDGQLMLAPGRYEIELINKRLNYRETKTLEVKPGEVTAYDVAPPMGVVRVAAPDGVEIRVDGEPAGRTPMGELSVLIGVREIVAVHPQLGERRQIVEVHHGDPTEVTLSFN